MLKKMVVCIFVFVFAWTGILPVSAGEVTEDGYILYEPDDWTALAENDTPSDGLPVTVRAKAAVLMDQGTGQVLLEQNAHEKLYPASVTKIMAMLLVAEAVDSGEFDLSSEVTASAVASGKGGSQIWLREGETMTGAELLKATAVYSANDACTALGEAIAGSSEAFVRRMNDRARELGMQDTNFVNCTGLDDDTTEHLTTAYDIALMSRELLRHDWITEYTTIWMDSLRGGATQLVNTNKLVRFYDGATGLKTGTTNKAGCCVSASARREQTHLIAVVMGSENSKDRFEGAKSLLNWGFANYETIFPQIDRKLCVPVRVIGGVQSSIRPRLPQTTSVLIPKGKAQDVTQSITLAADVHAPVEKGQTLGKVTFQLDGQTLGEYRLTAGESVERLTVPILFRRLVGVFAKQDFSVFQEK